MARVLGLGGVFFKARDPEKLASWYKIWLDFDIDASFGGTVFKNEYLAEGSYSVWAPHKNSSKYFDPSQKDFMINFVVDDVEALLSRVKQGGAEVHGTSEEPQGKFGWFSDPEGNKIELWQP